MKIVSLTNAGAEHEVVSLGDSKRFSQCPVHSDDGRPAFHFDFRDNRSRQMKNGVLAQWRVREVPSEFPGFPFQVADDHL